jgi:sugar/nucleoside kinase (ribokinase family)
MARVLFVGLITLDCIYQVDRVPTSDEKIVAQDNVFAAGGPATNAAVACRHLGNEAVVLAALGRHPITAMIRTDLEQVGVQIVDLTPDSPEPPPISTILVTEATGERAVVSRNAVGRQVPGSLPCADYLTGVDSVLIDGHQMAVGLEIARLARQHSIPVVIDAGSWKPGFEAVLPLATSVIAAAKFRLPDQTDDADPLMGLSQMDLAEVAVTHGGQPIEFCQGSVQGTLPVPQVSVRDTLGAGDIFHGAFCHYRLSANFQQALHQAAAVAAQSCQTFGTRAWLETPTPA